ncbi:MAG: alkane 1-monooxygenase, partial [Gammaproteobacteria bacterium]|nr:alkane 1-monooxygenase [Gammaproteobacteria bacterium]
PQLPGGYASMILPAYFPQTWYEMMDNRVIEHYKGDLSKINMDPDRKEELLQKYAAFAAEVAARHAADASAAAAEPAEASAA